MVSRLINRLKRDQRGVAALEFALSLPLLVLLVFGAVEVTRYVLATQMVNNVARTMADLSSQGENMTSSELTSMFSAIKFVAKPFDMQTNGRVIVSSLSAVGANPPTMNWQQSQGDVNDAVSVIGTPGDSLTLPAGFTVRSGFTVIVAEAYYDFSPILLDYILPPRRLYRASFFRARRLGALTSLL